MLVGNAVIGQSGGPTSAINATLSGVIRGLSDLGRDGTVTKVFGMRNGIEGFIRGDLVDLSDRMYDEEWLSILETTPAAALGSCRKRLKSYEDDKETYEKILSVLEKNDIRYFFYIGGNDSMDTVLKLSEYAKGSGYDMRVIGVPKTIDNDLVGTDHTPGFGSAAKYVATTVKEIMRDISVYTVRAVTIVEIMGRDAGWLTAASALPSFTGDAPALIYLPEHPFDIDEFIGSLEKAMEKNPAVLVAVSEGIKFANGEYVGSGNQSGAIDAFGHKYLSGAGKVLENIVKEKLGCKVRSVELNLPQRCAAHIASLTDINESVGVGRAAVLAAINGASGVMVSIVRNSGDDYSVSYGTTDIRIIANEIKKVPQEFINEYGNGVTDACIEYLRPLIIGETSVKYEYGLPKHVII